MWLGRLTISLYLCFRKMSSIAQIWTYITLLLVVIAGINSSPLYFKNLPDLYDGPIARSEFLPLLDESVCYQILLVKRFFQFPSRLLPTTKRNIAIGKVACHKNP
jgi:hypothetical protein